MIIYKKFLLPIIIILLCFISCPIERNNDYSVRIENYPDWMTWYKGGGNSCIAASEWMDWQGEQGLLLHDYIPKEAISGDYLGKFRIYYSDQYVGIQFNDPDSTLVRAMYLWIKHPGDNGNNGRISFYQSNPELYYEFDCYCKKRTLDKATESNKAHVKFTRLKDGDKDIGFNYFLKVAGKTVIDVDLKTPITKGELKLNENHSWLKFTPVGNNDTYYNFFPIDYNNVCVDSFWVLKGLDGTGNILIETDSRIEKYFYYCFEGISLRYVDDTTQTLQLNLLDAEESDFADYLEFVRNGDKGKLTYYKLILGVPTVVKEYDDIDCID